MGVSKEEEGVEVWGRIEKDKDEERRERDQKTILILLKFNTSDTPTNH